MPSIISEDDIEKALLKKLKQDFGFELLNCYTAADATLKVLTKYVIPAF